MRLLGLDIGSRSIRVSDRRSEGAAPPVQRTSESPIRVQALDNAAGYRLLGVRDLLCAVAEDAHAMATLRYALPPDVVGLSEEACRCSVAVPFGLDQRGRATLKSRLEDIFDGVLLLNQGRAALMAHRQELAATGSLLVLGVGAGPTWCGLYDREENGFRPIREETDAQSGGDALDASVLTLVLDMMPDGHRELLAEDEAALSALVAQIVQIRIAGVDGDVPLDYSDIVGDWSGAAQLEVPAAVWHQSQHSMLERALDLLSAVREDVRPEAVLACGGFARSATFRRAIGERAECEVVQAADGAHALGALEHASTASEKHWVSATERLRSDSGAPTGRPATTEERADELAEDSDPEQARWSDHFAPDMDRAQAQFESGRYRETLESLETVLSQMGSFAGNVYMSMARALETDGRLDGARKIAARAVGRDPGNRLFAYAYADYCVRIGCSRESLLAPKERLAYLGEAEQAIKPHLDRHEDAAPALARVRYARARVLIECGRLHDAAKLLRPLTKEYPDDEAYRRDWEWLQKKVGQGPARRGRGKH